MPALLDVTLRFFTVPSNLLATLLVLGVIGLLAGLRRPGGVATALATGLLLVCGYTTLGIALQHPLELRFPPGPEVSTPPTGIIILGGAIDASLSRDGRPIPLNEAGDRFTAAAELAARFPDAVIFIASGGAPPGRPDATELTLGTELLASFGVARDRITGDDRSVDTWDNARFAYDVLRPQPSQMWLIVTSAIHMPRTMGAFRASGWTGLVAWPVDYRSRGTEWPGFTLKLSAGLGNIDEAAHEWVGLAAYYLRGRSPSLLPGPEQPRRQDP
ncbi:YdcF family protein [Amorphus sp. MBR-141]